VEAQKNTSKVDETFAQKSQNFLDHSGGNPSTYETDGYKAWLATVPANPAIVFEKTIIIPLQELANDAVIRANIKAALLQYCSTGPIA